MIRKDARIAIRASVRGTRSGFAVLPDGEGGALTVTVLPKPWAAKPGRSLEAPPHPEGTSSHVTLHEGDVVVLTSSQTVVGALAQGLMDIADQKGRQDLLARVPVPRYSEPLPQSDGRPFDSVVALMLLASRQRSALDDAGFKGVAVESLLRLVEQQLFVYEVRRVIDRARPGYVERVERLTSPRGAASGSSLALALITGMPEVECRYDEQSTDTQVLQIVLAGLRCVATDRVPAALSGVAAGIQSQAVALARRLDSVSVLDRERALLTARRLVLHNLERPWAGAVDGAVRVLSRSSVVPLDGDDNTDKAVAIHLYMEKWWEECLEGALRAIADSGRVHPQHPVEAPWLPTTGAKRNADFVFALAGRHLLADAKYKVDPISLGADDGYQLFSYSHMAIVPGTELPTDAGAVFYPTRAKAGEQAQAHTRGVLARATGPAYELRLLGLPFPTADQVATDGAWRRYLVELGQGIRRELTSTTDGAADQPSMAFDGS
jgi:hypothetical protein